MMNKKILLVALSSVALVACNSVSNVSSDKTNLQENCNLSHDIVGGWAQIDVTPDVLQAAKYAVKAIPGDHHLGKIYNVKQQVVAGVNYSITFSIENGDYYSAIIFRSLQNTYHVKDIKQVPSITSNCDSYK